jgi:hypothetical protein
MKKLTLLLMMMLMVKTVNADNVLHTTIFHIQDQKPLCFLVTFALGKANKNDCQIQTGRIFTSTHGDGFRAHNYGRYLANEFGQKLYNCVVETLHEVNNQYNDQIIRYQLSNNGHYYTTAMPNISQVYFTRKNS